MSAKRLEHLEEPAARRAAARSRVYRLFVELLEYPDAGYVDAVRAGAWADALCTALGAVQPDLAGAVDGEALADAGPGGDELAVEYTRLFDVGTGGPPAPLYGGLYGGARMRTMEEAVRFYNFFGLHLAESPRELPDHLTTQLEFLHYLCFREAEALEAGRDAGGFQRAQRDFIERHPGRFVPLLCARVEAQEPLRFFPALFRALARFLEHERSELVSALGAVPRQVGSLGTAM